jgi:hypothetical protein
VQGKQGETQLATQIVELSGDEAALLRSLDKVIQKQLELDRKMRDTGEAGAAAGVQVEEALAKVEAEAAKTMKGLLAELKTLGPEGQAAATALKGHLQESGKAGMRAMDDVIAQLRLIDPEAAAAAEQASAAFVAAGQQSTSAWDEQLQILRDLGPEGAAAARTIEQDMRAAAAETAGGMQEVLDRLQQLDPAAAASAQKISEELSNAARYSEREFEGVLNELRAMGPEGRQAAAELKEHLVDAGKIAEKSIADVASKLDKIDPAAAKAARSIIENIEDTGKKGESVFESFGKSAIGQVTAIAGSYIGVQEAISMVNEHLAKQRQLIQEAKEAQLELAAAQQEAFKNLIGQSVIEQSDLLRNAVPEIARDTGFSDMGQLTLAIGSGVSAGGTEEQTLSAVTASAMLTGMTPDALDEYTKGALQIGRATGVDDAEQNLNLLLTAGGQALLDDPKKLASVLPTAVANTVGTTTGQDRQEASREAAALFGALTKRAGDSQGDSTSTNQTTFANYMRMFFKGQESDPGSVFGRLDALQTNPEMRAEFLEKLPGEAKFKLAFEELTDASSNVTKEMKAGFESIQLGTATFDEKVGQLQGATPQLALASFTRGAEGTLAAQDIQDTEGATLSAIREKGADVLENTSVGGISGFLDARFDNTRTGGLAGSTAAEESVDLINVLMNRRGRLEADGLQEGDTQKIQVIDDTIQNIQKLLQTQGQLGALDSDGVARAREQAAYLEEFFSKGEARDTAMQAQFAAMNELLAKIAETNAATANNTVPRTPSVSDGLANSDT